MTMIKPRGDLFTVVFPKNFIPQFIQNRWKPYINRMPTIIENVEDFVHESIQSISVPPLNYEPVEQSEWDGGIKSANERNHPSSVHPQTLAEKTFTVSFRMTDGYANYWILLESLMRHYSHQNNDNPYISTINIRSLDHEGNIMIEQNFHDVLFRGMSEYTLSYSSVQQDFMNFDCNFTFTNFEFKFPGEDIN